MNIEQLIEALHPFGDVLEVGFGPSSKEIQKYAPRSHTILSSDPKAFSFAKSRPSVKVVNDIWQSALPSLGVFDAIYFGIDPMEHEWLVRYTYTDSELDAFCSGVKEKKPLSRFLAELERNGQITGKQKKAMIQKYRLTDEEPPSLKRSGEMLQFLKACLASHMRKGSRFSCFLKSDIDDPQFFNEIAVDPRLDVRWLKAGFVIEKLA